MLDNIKNLIYIPSHKTHTSRPFQKKRLQTRISEKNYVYLLLFLIGIIVIILLSLVLVVVLEGQSKKPTFTNRDSNKTNEEKSPNKTSTDKEPSLPIPIKADEVCFSIEGNTDNFWKIPLGTITFRDNEKQKSKLTLIDTSISYLMQYPTLELQDLSEEKQKEFLSSQHVLKENCLSDFKNRFCVSRIYKNVYYTNFVGTIFVLSNATPELQSFPVVSEVITKDKDNAYDHYLLGENTAVLGVGFLDREFESNSFFNGLTKHLKTVYNKEVPQIFSMNFDKDKFSAFVGKEINENEYVSVELAKNKDFNVFEVKSIFVNKEKINNSHTYLFFNTGTN